MAMLATGLWGLGLYITSFMMPLLTQLYGVAYSQIVLKNKDLLLIENEKSL